MKDFEVAEVSLSTALVLNEGLNDDKKVAFNDSTNTKYFVKKQFAEDNLQPSDIIDFHELTQLEVDGTTPVTKLRRIYP